jgi:phosphate-selective porin OprO/OprP
VSTSIEDRLRALEERNHALERQYEALRSQSEADRRESERRYRELAERYEAERREPRGALEVPASSLPAAGPRAPDLERREQSASIRDRNVESSDSMEGRQFEGSTAAADRDRDEPPTYPLQGRFDDGFLLETPDSELQLRVHIMNQTDFKVFTPNDMLPARSGLYIPRSRVYFEGRLTRGVGYEVSIQRSVEGIWDLLDGNVDFRPSEAFQLRFGRMLVPYSYDWYDHLEQYFITPERGLFPLNYGLSRTAGLMAHGTLGDGRLQYALGGFDGRLAGVADNNTTRDLVGYLNARPFLDSERFPRLRNLNLGGSIFGGLQFLPASSLPLRTSLQSSENDEAARAASAKFLEFEEDVYSFGDRSAGALHLAWYTGGLSVEAEWQVGEFGYIKQVEEGKFRSTLVPVSGYHVTMGYFLTGEEVEGRRTVVPLRPFGIANGQFGPGAIEIFARYSQLDLGREVFTAGLANSEDWARSAYMADIGFNWYMNRFIKFYVDWQLPYFSSPVLVNEFNGLKRDSANLFWVRCQLYY